MHILKPCYLLVLSWKSGNHTSIALGSIGLSTFVGSFAVPSVHTKDSPGMLLRRLGPAQMVANPVFVDVNDWCDKWSRRSGVRITFLIFHSGQPGKFWAELW